MDGYEKSLLICFAILASALCIILSLSLNYRSDTNKKIVDLIKSGTPAIEAICAMQEDYEYCNRS